MNEIRFIGPVRENGYLHDGSQPYKCYSCGLRPTAKITSGTPECGACWNWRKLDGNAAVHWLKASAMFASNVDFHDLTSFIPNSCGVSADEFQSALEVAEKIFTASKAMLIEHGRNEEGITHAIQESYKAMTAASTFKPHPVENTVL